MTKEQARRLVATVGAQWGGPEPDCGMLVDQLVALGLLKLDTPDTIHADGCRFIADMIPRWRTPDAVAEDMAKMGYRIVRAK
jgi:hypothetical protein